MSPEKARICIIDDQPMVIDGLSRYINYTDHAVILSAETVEEAMETVDQFADLGINVVLLDTKPVPGDDEGKNSQLILDKIREIAPDVKVITMSSGTPLAGGDKVVNKGISGEQLVHMITDL